MNVLGAVLAPRQVMMYTRAYGSMQGTHVFSSYR
jgi:hypothetical protein